MPVSIGIDPGASGGIAVIDGGSAVAYKMPNTVSGLCDLLESLPRGLIIVESVAARPGQGVASMFKFGRSFGQIEGVLMALRLPHDFVSPQVWCKAFGLRRKRDESASAWKNRHKDVARRLYPDAKITHWSADAILIAEYNRRVRQQ